MDENDPIQPDEYVLRRINNNRDWYKPELDQPVTRVACSPFKKDIDGLSVFRERFISPAELAAAGPHPDGYYVARLLVSEIQKLGLTLVPAPLPGGPKGHTIIPELNYTAASNSATKPWAKDVANQLAKLAGQNIAVVPGQY